MKHIHFSLTLLLAATLSLSAFADNNTFKVAALNVDGLPASISLGITSISLNPDSKGADGATAISQKLATMGYDVIGLSEDFNYNTEIMSAIDANLYGCGTYRGGIALSGLSYPFDTDGLQLLWRKSQAVASDETIVGWNQKNGKFTNGADELIDKGYRYYLITVNDSVQIDLYIVHMDAECDEADLTARWSQWSQLTAAIIASNNGRPIIVMGDTNSRYTRDKILDNFTNVLNADSRFTVKDAWVQYCRNGVYPEFGADALMVTDPTLGYQLGEVVDKVLFINNTRAPYYLQALSYLQDTSFVNASGEPLADHWPVVVEFAYYKKELASQAAESVDYTNVQWHGENPTAGGQYYIFHPNSKTFLSINNTSLAAVSEPTFLWTMDSVSASENIFTMKMHNAAYYFNLAKGGTLGTSASPSLSTTEQTTQISLSTTNTNYPAYKIHRTASPARYLNYDGSSFTGAQTASVQNDWVFISEQQFRDSVPVTEYIDPNLPDPVRPADPATATALHSEESLLSPAVKFFRNGVLYIRRGDDLFTLSGEKVK